MNLIRPKFLLVSTETFKKMLNVNSNEKYRNLRVEHINTFPVNGKFMHQVYVGNKIVT